MARIRVKVNLDLKKIDARVTQILEDYGPQISVALQDSIANEQFDYPVDTYRRARRQFVPKGLRDIIDTGTLLQSQTAPVVQKNILTIRWTAPYSKAVLEGGYIVESKRGNYVAPARNWITPALREKPFIPFVVNRWRALSQ